jgi:hypothetical protein
MLGAEPDLHIETEAPFFIKYLLYKEKKVKLNLRIPWLIEY